MSFGFQAILSLLVVGLSLEVIIQFPILEPVGLGLFGGGVVWFVAIALSFFDEREAINIASGVIVKAQPEPTSKAQPFPPLAFVHHIWSHRERTGKFPTIDEVVSGMSMNNSKMNRAQVQTWYEQMVAAGAIVGRKERVSAGEPAWDFNQFREAAIDAATGGNV